MSKKAEGLRYNTGKLRFDLMPWEWVQALVEVITRGAVKYEPRNWEKGLNWGDTLASLKRHVHAWETGEWYDQETGCHHLAHAAWNALALLSMQLRGIGVDDLPAYGCEPTSIQPNVTENERG